MFEHRPVLLEEVLEVLLPAAPGVFIDATVGGGGHARAILERTDERTRLIGIDRDPAAIAAAEERLVAFGDRVRLIRAPFSTLDEVVTQVGWEAPVRGVLFDLGVSSHQLETADRGFSYQADGPLDMRQDPDAPLTAADLVNRASERELTDIIRRYGQERWASRIAQFIAERRQRRPLERTGELVEVIKAAVPAAARRRGGHPARRTFQALRIALNDELGELERGLTAAERVLAVGGRLAVISFHSLEDRIVKHRLREGTAWRVLSRKPIEPSESEIAANSRSRSARLRSAERF